ncbi:MAG: ABC transporter substrate-binding protein [Deltaproteobacteria bacterium]|nr:ABC transporter substrate-binding protein [Deltaproteobacteria bacterium]
MNHRTTDPIKSRRPRNSSIAGRVRTFVTTTVGLGLSLSLSLSLSFVTPARAAPPASASTTAKSTQNASADAVVDRVRASVDRALEILRDPKLQGKAHTAERHTRLRAVSDEMFDWTRMAQKSLGVHWRKLSDKDRTRFTTTFKELLAKYYLDQIDRFQGQEEVLFKGTGNASEGDTEVKMTLVTSSKEEVPIHFFVDAHQKVVDVSIEGVSIANHYRGTFDRLLVNGTFDDMMKKLERKRGK